MSARKEGQLRLLLVDDEESMRLTLGANLELEGFDVHEAGDADEALALLEKQTFDLMLSDIRMPGADGVELFRRAKLLHPDMPVLLMTAFALERRVDEAILGGVFSILRKPFDIDGAVGALRSAAHGPFVLVVDDLDAAAEALTGALRAAGLKAMGESNGARAIELVRSGDVDVAIVDLVMPGLDGPTVIANMHDIDRTVACIGISAHDMPELVRKVAAVGARVCVRKPVEPLVLLREIVRARSLPS